MSAATVHLVRAALDDKDRLQAAGAWCGLVLGGIVISVVILALNWSRRDSLARAHAVVATWMWVGVLAVYVPISIRLAVVGEPDSVFFMGWAVAAVVVVTSSVMGIVLALRAPMAASPDPGEAQTQSPVTPLAPDANRSASPGPTPPASSTTPCSAGPRSS